MSKYKSSKVIVTADGTVFKLAELKQYNQPIPEGVTFDSMAEAEYYNELRLRKQSGHIKDFELQPLFILQEKMVKNGVTHRAIKYIADFRVINNDNSEEVIDIKGYETREFRLKLKMFEAKYPEMTLRVLTKWHGCWVSVDTAKKAKNARKRARVDLLKRAKVQE